MVHHIGCTSHRLAVSCTFTNYSFFACCDTCLHACGPAGHRTQLELEAGSRPPFESCDDSEKRAEQQQANAHLVYCKPHLL